MAVIHINISYLHRTMDLEHRFSKNSGRAQPEKQRRTESARTNPLRLSRLTPMTWLKNPETNPSRRSSAASVTYVDLPPRFCGFWMEPVLPVLAPDGADGFFSSLQSMLFC